MTIAEGEGESQGWPTVWRYQAVHTETGQVVNLPRAKPTGSKWRQQHVVLFQEAMAVLAEEGKLGAEALRVLLFLLGKLEWDNWLVIPQRLVATALRMKQQNVSRAMRQLVGRGILSQAPPPAPRSTYRFNSNVVYKGQANGWHRLQREERQQREAPQKDALGAHGGIMDPDSGTALECPGDHLSR